MKILLFCIIICILIVLLVHRIWKKVVPARMKSIPYNAKNSGTVHKQGTVPTMVVLGSGGHTTEMLKLIKKLCRKTYTPVIFVVADTDKTSEMKTMLDWKPSSMDTFLIIPRSREVGQSWMSTVWTTLISFFHCLKYVYIHKPQLLLCNGPGTCLPICIAVILYRFLGINGMSSSKIIFCESFCRVKSLSLTGKLLYPLVDEFVVQWQQLQTSYPRTKYLGVIC